VIVMSLVVSMLQNQQRLWKILQLSLMDSRVGRP